MFNLYSCQPIENLDKIVFDYNLMPKITISAENYNIIEIYEAKFDDPYIDHSIIRPPKYFLKQWFDNNFTFIGVENSFKINILDASLKRSEILNLNSKKYEENTVFLYDITLLVEYIISDESNSVLSNVIVETNRTTTSGKFISLQEKDNIIENLILDSLVDFANKSEELIKINMLNYIL